MQHVTSICKQQRQRRLEISKKKEKLARMLNAMKTCSGLAMNLLAQLNLAHEESVAVGKVIVSKIEHSVALDSVNNEAVQNVHAAIEYAEDAYKDANVLYPDTVHVHKTINELSTAIMDTQRLAHEAVEEILTANETAKDVHHNALCAIESELNITDLRPETFCARCGCPAGHVYAARTGLCADCLAETDMHSGWVKLVRFEEISNS
jgi:hypothetical protein